MDQHIQLLRLDGVELFYNVDRFFLQMHELSIALPLDIYVVLNSKFFNYLVLKVILALVKSYGVKSTVTLSPGKIRM